MPSEIERIMSRPVFACHADASVETAAKEMWDRDCGVVAVVDDAGCLVGMITDRDICMAAYTRGERLADIPVRSAMSADLQTCRATDTVATVEAKMKEKRVRRIPVVDDTGRPVGIVSLNDLARTAVRPDASRGDDLGRVADTLAVIGEPRSKSANAA
jgi:CBS domain-containing protein